MAAARSISLQIFVYRTLSLRLAVMAIVVALITGGLVFLAERQTLLTQVAEESRAEIQLLVARTTQIMRNHDREPRAAFNQALEERMAVAVKPPNGNYVYVNFFRLGAGESEERRDADYPLIDAVVDFARSLPRQPSAPGREAGLVRLQGRPHVWVMVPIANATGAQPTFALAVFVPSEATLQTISRNLRHSVLMTLLIVAATSGLLYPVILLLVRRLTQFSRNLLDANLGTLSLLASAIAKRDSDTDVHNFRVTLYAIRLAEALHVDNATLQTLIKGSFVHDVGKIGVRDDILLKPGRLDGEEVAQMREHVRHGLEIIAASPWLGDAAEVVGGHHERFDGSGYPAGLAGEAIPLVARIFAVVDVFDALTSQRPYKEPIGLPATLEMLRQGRGSHFDPAVLDVFCALAEPIYQAYAGRDDQGLRDELQRVITRVFSAGEIVLDVPGR